jgi:hypothetical protein
MVLLPFPILINDYTSLKPTPKLELGVGFRNSVEKLANIARKLVKAEAAENINDLHGLNTNCW